MSIPFWQTQESQGKPKSSAQHGRAGGLENCQRKDEKGHF